MTSRLTCVIVSRDTGVCLTIPEGAVRQGGNVEIFLAVLRDDRDRPKLSGRSHIALLSLCLFIIVSPHRTAMPKGLYFTAVVTSVFFLSFFF